MGFQGVRGPRRQGSGKCERCPPPSPLALVIYRGWEQGSPWALEDPTCQHLTRHSLGTLPRKHARVGFVIRMSLFNMNPCHHLTLSPCTFGRTHCFASGPKMIVEPPPCHGHRHDAGGGLVQPLPPAHGLNMVRPCTLSINTSAPSKTL